MFSKFFNSFPLPKFITQLFIKKSPLYFIAYSTLSLHAHSATVFISELHYDNLGSDIEEMFEITAETGLSLENWSVYFYNGNDGKTYKNVALSGIIEGSENFGALSFFVSGIQNGSADGLALIDDNAQVVEFISYEGVLMATNGPANGLSSKDIGISEPSDSVVGQSLQRINFSPDQPSTSWILDTSTINQVNTSISSVPIPGAAYFFAFSMTLLGGLRKIYSCKKNYT